MNEIKIGVKPGLVDYLIKPGDSVTIASLQMRAALLLGVPESSIRLKELYQGVNALFNKQIMVVDLPGKEEQAARLGIDAATCENLDAAIGIERRKLIKKGKDILGWKRIR